MTRAEGVAIGSEGALPIREARGTAALDWSLLRGIAWTGAMRSGVQVVTWASTLVVFRLLDPADYGIVGMALAYVGLIAVVNEFGFGAAIVQQRGLGTTDVADVGGLAVAGGATLALVSCMLSGTIAGFFGEPAVHAVVSVLSLGFVLSALQVVPRSLLARDLDFRRLAWLDAAEAVTASAVTISLAATGFGYWALVAGPLTGRLVVTSAINVWRPHRLTWPRDMRPIAGAVRFGWHTVVARLAWYTYANADFAIVGRILGKAALGAYTIGWTVASVPVDRIGGLVASVAFPVFARVQDDRAGLRRYLRSLTEGISLVTFPVAVGLAMVADEFVLVAVGDRWRAAIAPLRLLALAAALRSVTPLLPQVLVAVGETRRNARVTVFLAFALPTLFIIGSHWGTTGVGAAWLVGHPLLVTPAFLIPALRITGLTPGQYARSFAPAALATATMAGVVLVVRIVTPGTWPIAGRLVLHVTVGVLAYAGVLRGVYWERVRTILALWREMRRGAGETARAMATAPAP